MSDIGISYAATLKEHRNKESNAERSRAMAVKGEEEDGTIKGPDGHPLEKKYDAKGKEIISPEEKARREAKERKISAEVGLWFT